MSYYGGYGSGYGGHGSSSHINYGSGGYGGYGGYNGGYGRTTNWCPSGEGYPAYCPQSGDDYTYTHCCTPFFIGSYEPTCCYFALSVWNIIAIIIGILILLALLILSIRWCWPKMYPNRHQRTQRTVYHQQPHHPQQPYRGPSVVQYEKEPVRHY